MVLVPTLSQKKHQPILQSPSSSCTSYHRSTMPLIQIISINKYKVIIGIDYKFRMIWDIIEQSSFNKHFQKQDLTIEELLVDENILTQMKNLNPQLLEFINKNLDEIIMNMIKYTIIMPKQEEGYDRCHKLPYVSSEMLAINSDIFYQAFLPKDSNNQKGHLGRLFAFLDSQFADNQLLLGYFEKVTGNLYNGRKLQFVKAVSQNLPLFCKHLDMQTIGNILKNCVILQSQKQGIVFDERKKIVSTLITNFVQPKTENKQKLSDVKYICSNALIQIIGRHQTFSSGDELLKYILCFCGQLLLIYSQIQQPEVTRFLIGVLTKSTQKKYDPQLDQMQPIFKIPPQHEKLLQGYLPLRLHYCQKKSPSAAANSSIRQQDGTTVSKIPQEKLDYLRLVAISLENQIDQFITNTQIDFKFAWECMRSHPKNDILLVQVDKIFLYAFSDRSKNSKTLHKNLLQKFKIIDKFCQIFQDEKGQRVLRPHLFQLWNKMMSWVPESQKQNNKQWQNICQIYQKLIPLHAKASGLNYNRPTNAKLVVDEQEASAMSNKNKNSSEQKQVLSNEETSASVAWRQDPFRSKQQEKHQKQKNDSKQSVEQKQIKKQIMQELKQFNDQWNFQQSKQVNKDNPFDEFGDFFNNYKQEKTNTDSQQMQKKQKEKDKNTFDDFSQFDSLR